MSTQYDTRDSKRTHQMSRANAENDQMSTGGHALAPPPFQLKAGSGNMPEDVRGQMEGAFQTDFSNVNIHQNSQSATDVGALAYTQGNDVHFAPGQFKPNTSAGQELIGHELTHVVQQRAGKVKPTTQAAGMPVNDDRSLENEADVMGKKAASGESVQMKCTHCEKEEKNATQMKRVQPIQGFGIPDWMKDAANAGSEFVGDVIDTGREVASDVGDAIGGAVDTGVEFASQRPWAEDPANFCKPYTSTVAATAAKTYAYSTLIPSSAAMFGSEVSSIWRSYLGSGGYRTYAKGSGISDAFAASAVMQRHHSQLMRIAQTSGEARFLRCAANTWEDVPVGEIFSTSDLEFPINFSNPYDIPGHIAGGASGSDYGPDTRLLTGHMSVYRSVDATGNTTNIQLKSKFTFKVNDGVDFCPGGAGTGLEQKLTIPLSRLEATGMAFDVGFNVTYDMPEAMASFAPGTGGGAIPEMPDEGRDDRDRTGEVERGMEEKDRVQNR